MFRGSEIFNGWVVSGGSESFGDEEGLMDLGVFGIYSGWECCPIYLPKRKVITKKIAPMRITLFKLLEDKII